MKDGEVWLVPYEVVDAPDFGRVVLAVEIGGETREIQFDDERNWFAPVRGGAVKLCFDGRGNPTHVAFPGRGKLRIVA